MKSSYSVKNPSKANSNPAGAVHKTMMLFAIIFYSGLTFSQTLKVYTGPSFSRVEWRVGDFASNLLPHTQFGYSFFLGVDYLEKKRFFLSSNVGMVRKGGRHRVMLTDFNGQPTGEFGVISASLDYGSLQTLASMKVPITPEISPFLGLGPRVDYLLVHSEHFDAINGVGGVNKMAYGLIAGGGAQYQKGKLQLGVRLDYYLEFNTIANWPVTDNNVGGSIRSHTLAFNISAGIKIE
jgi:hypothetical protein